MSKFHSCVKKIKLVSQNVDTVLVLCDIHFCRSLCRWRGRVHVSHLMVIRHLTYSEMSSSCHKSCMYVQELVMRFLPSRSGWLIHGSNTSKKVYARIPWSFGHLCYNVFAFCAWNKFWYKQNMWPLRNTCNLTHLIVKTTCLPVLPWGLLNSHTLFIHWDCGFSGNSELCAWMEK